MKMNFVVEEQYCVVEKLGSNVDRITRYYDLYDEARMAKLRQPYGGKYSVITKTEWLKYQEAKSGRK